MARTCYEYHNDDVAFPFKTGLLYLDSDTGLIQYQCNGSWTGWHGHFKITADQMMVAFDCREGTRDGPPRLKSSVLFLTQPGGVYKGFDYKLRNVTVTPKAKFQYEAGTGAWTKTQEWSPGLLQWMELV